MIKPSLRFASSSISNNRAPRRQTSGQVRSFNIFTPLLPPVEVFHRDMQPLIPDRFPRLLKPQRVDGTGLLFSMLLATSTAGTIVKMYLYNRDHSDNCSAMASQFRPRSLVLRHPPNTSCQSLRRAGCTICCISVLSVVTVLSAMCRPV